MLDCVLCFHFWMMPQCYGGLTNILETIACLHFENELTDLKFQVLFADYHIFRSLEGWILQM
jgi:hypothetical protein